MAEDLITTGEAARVLGVRSVNTVKHLIEDGRLPAIRPGSHYRVRRADVERLASARRRDHTKVDPLDVPRDQLAAWADRHGVKRLSLFGSAARREMGPDSDVDLLMELRPEAQVGLLRHARMARELETIFGHPVDLGTWSALKPHVRSSLERDALVLYEA